MLARRCDGARRALPVSLVGSRPAPDGCDLVPLSDLFFDRNPIIGEGDEQQFGDVPSPLEQIGAHDLLQDGVLAPVMELPEVSAHDGLVFFRRHHGPPSARSLLCRNSATPRSSAPLTCDASFTRVCGRASPNFAGTEF